MASNNTNIKEGKEKKEVERKKKRDVKGHVNHSEADSSGRRSRSRSLQTTATRELQLKHTSLLSQLSKPQRKLWHKVRKEDRNELLSMKVRDEKERLTVVRRSLSALLATVAQKQKCRKEEKGREGAEKQPSAAIIEEERMEEMEETGVDVDPQTTAGGSARPLSQQQEWTMVTNGKKRKTRSDDDLTSVDSRSALGEVNEMLRNVRSILLSDKYKVIKYVADSVLSECSRIAELVQTQAIENSRLSGRLEAYEGMKRNLGQMCTGLKEVVGSVNESVNEVKECLVKVATRV